MSEISEAKEVRSFRSLSVEQSTKQRVAALAKRLDMKQYAVVRQAVDLFARQARGAGRSDAARTRPAPSG